MRKPLKDAPLITPEQEALLTKSGMDRQTVLANERKLAKFAVTMDSLIRIPFTKQGVGADVALSAVPFAGDIASAVITCYAFVLAKRMGVPMSKLTPAMRLAVVDMVVGFVPIVGDLIDVFIRPSQRTLGIVREHARTAYGLDSSIHVQRPFLHSALEKKQQNSSFWRNPIVGWVYLHIPDILGGLVIIAGLVLVLLLVRFVFGLF